MTHPTDIGEPRVKERGILFSAPMVRALLAGMKTQTRRPVKHEWNHMFRAGDTAPRRRSFRRNESAKDDFVTYSEPYARTCGEPVWFYGWGNGRWLGRCPYGVVGDRLWVREAIVLSEVHPHPDLGDVALSSYEADGAATKADAWPWKRERLPSMFCPRGLSRITLEITEVRVQRLQDISLDDARAEGIPQMFGEARKLGLAEWAEGDTVVGNDGGPNARDVWDNSTSVENYARLWDDINGPGSWDANPWIWAISFKRVSP